MSGNGATWQHIYAYMTLMPSRGDSARCFFNLLWNKDSLMLKGVNCAEVILRCYIFYLADLDLLDLQNHGNGRGLQGRRLNVRVVNFTADSEGGSKSVPRSVGTAGWVSGEAA